MSIECITAEVCSDTGREELLLVVHKVQEIHRAAPLLVHHVLDWMIANEHQTVICRHLLDTFLLREKRARNLRNTERRCCAKVYRNNEISGFNTCFNFRTTRVLVQTWTLKPGPSGCGSSLQLLPVHSTEKTKYCILCTHCNHPFLSMHL